MRRTVLLFATTLFFSAGLLFCVQPMVGRLLLPLLGGSPQVWSTCLVFFQGALLTGYTLAHLVATRLSVRWQAIVHTCGVAIPVVVLPIAIPETGLPVGVQGIGPALWVMSSLLVAVGLPFVALSMNGPLLQRWYSWSGAKDADDPYFLYAASNCGSLIGLLGYPLLAEPLLGTKVQVQFWAWGYGAMALLVAATAWRTATTVPADARVTEQKPIAAIPLSRQARWLGYAAIPSSLLLGVTTFLTTDLAAIPLLWVIPLALYLLTWVATFSRRPWLSVAFTSRALPILVVGWLLLYLSEATEPAWALVSFHLLAFVAAALLCHGQLAADRPEPQHLTRFFLLTSLGGVVGGAFNALLAPLVLPDLWEYPLALLAACLALPGVQSRAWRDLVGPALVVGLALLLLAAVDSIDMAAGPARTIVTFGIPVLGAWLLVDRPIRFVLAAGALLLIAPLSPSPSGEVVRTERSFFGVQRVTVDASGRFDQVVHGHTLHGRQWREPSKKCIPLAYYHHSGPLGDIVAARRGRFGDVAMIGMGAGTMLNYKPSGARWLLVDIDPATWTLARERFTFLRDCPAHQADRRSGTRELLADGRQAIADLAPERRFDAIVIDVFTSDAIPVHMLTREAFAIYLRHLRDDGILVFHASNRYLDVVAVLAAVAFDHGLKVRFRDDRATSREPGTEPSRWLVAARDKKAFSDLVDASGWRRPCAHDRVWTDDFNDLPRVFWLGMVAGPSQSSACPDSAQQIP